MEEVLKELIGKYLPTMEPGSTILDAGCHRGAMYDILINGMRIDVKYSGIDWIEEFVQDATKLYGNHFSHANIMNYHTKHDYVWCSQMTLDDNPFLFRHLAGLARKKLIYTHIHPQRNHENVMEAVKVFHEDNFVVVVA